MQPVLNNWVPTEPRAAKGSRARVKASPLPAVIMRQHSHALEVKQLIEKYKVAYFQAIAFPDPKERANLMWLIYQLLALFTYISGLKWQMAHSTAASN